MRTLRHRTGVVLAGRTPARVGVVEQVVVGEDLSAAAVVQPGVVEGDDVVADVQPTGGISHHHAGAVVGNNRVEQDGPGRAAGEQHARVAVACQAWIVGRDAAQDVAGDGDLVGRTGDRDAGVAGIFAAVGDGKTTDLDVGDIVQRQRRTAVIGVDDRRIRALAHKADAAGQ